MMVKDEASNLERCLNSIQNIMKQLDSELIIVDTGSKDNTVNIAKKYTDRVYFHPWNNNFSEMRNVTIKYAKGEWLFILDADEEIKDDSGIIEFFKLEETHRNFNALCITYRNFTSDKTAKTFSDMSSLRFFKNDGEFHYEGLVHNVPIYKNPIGSLQGIVYHYGYLKDDFDLMEKKFLRTSTLLVEALEIDPDNIYYRYQLSVSFAMYQKWVEAEIEALAAYKKIQKLTAKEKDPYFYLFGQLIIIYKRIGKYDNVIRYAQKALEVRRDDIDSLFFMADAYIYNGSKDLAIPYLKRYLALVLKYEKQEISINLDVKLETIGFKEKALYNLLSIYYFKNEYSEVLRLYTKFIELMEEGELDEKIIEIVIKSAVNQKALLYVFELYNHAESQLAALIENQIENQMISFEKETRNELLSLFKKNSGHYGELNRLRIILEGNIIDSRNLYKKIEAVRSFNQIYYADVFFKYYFLINNCNGFVDWIISKGFEDSLEIVDRLNHLYDYFEKWILDNLMSTQSDEIEQICFKNTVQKYFLMAYSYENRVDQALPLFELFILDRYRFLSRLYLQRIIENEAKWIEIESIEDRMILYLNRVNNMDPYESYEFMKKALEVSGIFRPYILKLIQDNLSEIELREKS